MTVATRTRPLRVLWLTKGLGRGGAERLLVDTAASIDTERYRVDVAYVMPVKDALVADLQAQGLHVVCLGSSDDRMPRWPLRLRALVTERDYDIVHTHMPLPAAAARLVLALPGHRRPAFVHTEHNVWQRYRRGTYWANALTYRRNARVIAVSQAVADSIDRRWLPPRRLVVIRHGLRPSIRRQTTAVTRSTARERLGLPDDAFVIGSVGNITAKKGHDVLLDAFVLTARQVTQARLVVIGGGPLESALRAEVARRRLDPAVVLTGSRTDVAELLPAFDVYASASWFEGLPIALIEALACGLPAVVTNAGGTAEVVRDGVDGLLVPPGDAAGLARALARLAADPQLATHLAAAARSRSREFDIDRASQQIQRLYDEVVQQP